MKTSSEVNLKVSAIIENIFEGKKKANLQWIIKSLS